MAMKAPVQLQFNQSGAWRGAVVFDAKGAPPELLKAADTLARLTDSTARIVACLDGANGRPVPSHVVIGTWSREKGWE